MIEFLRFLAITFRVCLHLCLMPVMFFVWCLFALVMFVVLTLVNIIMFSKGEEFLFESYNIIWWFFWEFVMWNAEKAEKFI